MTVSGGNHKTRTYLAVDKARADVPRVVSGPEQESVRCEA